MSARLRVGVIGMGFAAHVHVPALRACPDVDVVAIAGSTAERANATAKRLGIDAGYGGFERLLARDDLDAVTMALPPAINAKALGLAIERRLPVLCEKPMSASGETAAVLANAARGLTTAVDFMFAELETFKRLTALVEQNALGKLRKVSVVWTAQSYAQRHRQWGWKADAVRCGGVLTMLGSHVLYLLEWFLGPVEIVSVASSSAATAAFAPPGAAAAEDTVQITLRAASGVTIEVALSNSAAGASLHRWVVEGEAAAATLENAGSDYVVGFCLTQQTHGAAAHILYRELAGEGDNRLAAVQPLFARFIEGVRHDAAVQPDLAAAARVDRLLDDARTRAQAGAVHLTAVQ